MVNSTVAVIEPRYAQQELDALYARLFGSPETSQPASPPSPTACCLADEVIIKRAQNAANGTKFRALWNGDTSDYDGDESRADQALCSMLSFWTQDPAQIERIFSHSVLGQRDKWQRRADYRERTIRKALERAEVYEPRRTGGLRVHRPLSLRVREVGHA